MGGDVPDKATSSFLSAAEIDLSSSAGVQKLLSVVRGTPMVHDDYNEIRDLIFSYKQSGGKPEIKKQIIDQLTQVGVVKNGAMQISNNVRVESSKSETASENENEIAETRKETPTSSTKPRVTSKLGGSRLRPTFSRVEVASPSPSQTAPDTKQPATEKGAASPEETIVKEEKQVEKADTPEPAPVEPAATNEAELQPAPATTNPVTAESGTVQSQPETNAAPVGVTYSDPLDRIKAIKQEVNKRVGNPINLIDADNEVGREYMNSLLAAMKTLNSGSSGEVDQAMDRLEKSFVKVKETIEKKAITPEPKEVEPKEVSAPAEKEEEQVSSTEEDVTATPPAGEKGQSLAERKLSVSSIEEGVEESPVDVPEAQTEVSETRATDDIESPFIPQDQKEEVKEGSATDQASDLAEKEEEQPFAEDAALPKNRLFTGVREAETPKVEEKSEEPASTESTTPFQSVAKEKQLENIMYSNQQQEAEAARAKEEEEIASMDPFMTPDVSNGLRQLLSEWSLFKSSGIFGTGPNGIDHPMYKKLAGLQMTAVVSGRFEGATPEVRQSITDYMNGWRYEEGIIHQHGETFEHYLRRVIKHILDSQNKGKVT